MAIRNHLKLSLLGALTLASCAQIVGISDYDIDTRLDGKSGSTSTDGGMPGVGGAAGPEGGATDSAGAAGASDTGGTAGTGGSAMGGVGAEAGVGGEATEPRELIPCDSSDCCEAELGTAIGEELLQDGGFELGPVINGDSPWTQESTGEIEAITEDLELGWKPKAGTFYSYLSGISGERTTLYSENLRVADDAGWFVLVGHRNFQVDATDDVNEDFAGVGFYSVPDGELVELPFYWSRPADSEDGWGETTGWARFTSEWPATPHLGLRRRLGLRAESDAYPTEDDASSYLFDEVSLRVFRCYK